MAKESSADQHMSEAEQEEVSPTLDEAAAEQLADSGQSKLLDERTKVYEDSYAFVSNGLYSSARSGGFLKNGSNGIFYFKTYVRTRTYTEEDLSEIDQDDFDPESNSIALTTETYSNTDSTMTIELSSSEMSFAKRTYYNFFEGADLTLYESYNIDDPTVTEKAEAASAYSTEEGNIRMHEYTITYKNDENNGIKEKYGTSSTGSYSDMLSTLSASATAIYNTTNTTRFNFNKTRAPNIIPINISAIAPVYYTTTSSMTSTESPTRQMASTPTSTGGGY